MINLLSNQCSWNPFLEVAADGERKDFSHKIQVALAVPLRTTRRRFHVAIQAVLVRFNVVPGEEGFAVSVVDSRTFGALIRRSANLVIVHN